eukprot:UN04978
MNMGHSNNSQNILLVAASGQLEHVCKPCTEIKAIVLIGMSRARNMNYLVINKYINAQQLMVKCIDLFYCIFVKMFVYIIGHHKSYSSFGNNEKIFISVKNAFELDVIGTKVKKKLFYKIYQWIKSVKIFLELDRCLEQK